MGLKVYIPDPAWLIYSNARVEAAQGKYWAMGRLEKRQAGAVSMSVLGVVLLLLAVVLTIAERGGYSALGVGMFGGLLLLLGASANARVSREMIHKGRR
jgi:hypothetical protein